MNYEDITEKLHQQVIKEGSVQEQNFIEVDGKKYFVDGQIGRASCRERV